MPIQRPAARTLQRVIQAPDSVCAQSVLGAAALSCQPYANISIDSREIPLSIFLLTVAESGDRKSGTDKAALKPIYAWQKNASGLYSLKKIEAKIAEMGLRNSLGNPIKANQVDFILNNPFYYGEMKVKGQLYNHNYPPLVTQALYDEVQAVKKGHGKAPVQYAGKPMLFRGLVTCDECSCAVTGDIKKGKYVYYSCNNAKGLCKKSWIREEILLEPLLALFDRIQLPDETVNKILGHLRKVFEHEQEFFNQSQATLRKELDQIQKRLSRLIDEHLDGNIDASIYQQKLQEYKKRQKEITREMEAHVDADETCLLTIKTVVDLAQRAKEIYLSSNLDEKRELLNLVYSNLKLREKRLLVTLREPFSLLMAASHQPMCLRVQDSNLRPMD